MSGIRQQGHGTSQAEAVGGGRGGLYTGKGSGGYCRGVVQGKGRAVQGKDWEVRGVFQGSAYALQCMEGKGSGREGRESASWRNACNVC